MDLDLAFIPHGDTIAVDTETTGLNPWKGCKPFAISFANMHGVPGMFRVAVDPKTRRLAERFPVRKLAHFFSDPSITKVFHNAAFDILMLEALGFQVCGQVHDTMFAAHVLNSLEPKFGLKPLAKKYAAIPDDDEEELRASAAAGRRYGRAHGWKLGEKVENDYWMAEPDKLARYATLDAVRTAALWFLFSKRLKRAKLWNVYLREIELLKVTLSMMRRGIKIDLDTCDEELAKLARDLSKWNVKARAFAPELNWASPAQLAKFFFIQCGLPEPTKCGKATKDFPLGQPSVALNVLEKLDHPLANLIVKIRGAEKARSTYFARFKALTVRDKKHECFCIHPWFNQIGPATGRYSSRDPNIQNVPDEFATRAQVLYPARAPFGPRKGYAWVLADYDQIEVRIFAAVSGEPFLRKALLSGRDIHTETANRVWGGRDNERALKAIMHVLRTNSVREGKRVLDRFDWNIVAAEASLGAKSTRARAKMLTFLKIFGGGVTAASELIGCDMSEAAEYIAEYDEAFPGVGQYIYRRQMEAMQAGGIYDLFGRWLTVDRHYAFRATNYTVQGSAASFLKDRMIAVYNWFLELRMEGLKAFQVITLHDEQILEVELRCLKPWFFRRLKRIMEDNGGRIDIPTPVSIKVCRQRWDSSTKVKV